MKNISTHARGDSSVLLIAVFAAAQLQAECDAARESKEELDMELRALRRQQSKQRRAESLGAIRRERARLQACQMQKHCSNLATHEANLAMGKMESFDAELQ
eukprot:2807668-Pleurochrysis_carterae.AAC.1